MKNNIIIAGLLLIFAIISVDAFAQSHPNGPRANGAEQSNQKQDKIQALRIAYFVEELNLNPEESIHFWPIWNQNHLQIESLQTAIKALEDQINGLNSEKEAEALALEMQDLHTQMLEQKHKMTLEIATVIGFKRALNVHKLEREFRGQILRARMNGTNGPERGPGNEKGQPKSPQQRLGSH